MNLRFEKKCDPMKTRARVTSPRFNPLSLAETGETVSYTHLRAHETS